MFGTLLSAIGHGMTLPFLFVYLHEIRHLDATVVGVVVAWMGLLSLVLAAPGGALIDRFGVRRVVLPLYVVEGAGTISIGYVHDAAQAFLVATLVAMGGSSVYAAFNTLLSSVTSEGERQRVFGLNFAILNLGIGVGGMTAGFIADNHDPGSFQLLYLVDGLGMMVPAAILLSMPAVGHRLVAAEAGIATGGYREVLAHRAFRRFLLFVLLITVCGYAQIEIGFSAFATLVSDVSPKVIAWALAANTVTIVLAQMAVISRLHGRSRSRALAGVGAVIALSWSVLGLSGLAGGSHPALAVAGVVVCAVVFACGETIMSPMMPAITNVLATDELRGRFNAMSSMIWGLTAIAGPLTAAPLIGHGLGGAWIVLLVIGSTAAALVALSLGRLLTPVQDGRVPTPTGDAESVRV